MIKIFIKIKKRYYAYRLREAVKKANRMAILTGQRYLVLRYKKRFLVKSKKALKDLVKDGYFVKGFTIQAAERIALYITR